MRPIPFRLCLRADDGGLNLGTDQGLVAVADAGLVRNLSVIACGPTTASCAALLRGRTDIDIGVHLCLTSETTTPYRPVLARELVSTWIEADGQFRALPNQHLEAGYAVEQAEAEFQAQIDRLRALGLDPVYVDEHMYFGWLPEIAEAVARVARRNGLIDQVRLGHVALLPGRREPADLHQRWLARLDAIEKPQGNWYAFVHPAIADAEMTALRLRIGTLATLHEERSGDLALCTGTWLREELARRGLQSTRFSALA